MRANRRRSTPRLHWKKKGYDDADFITNVYALKKQTDPSTVPPAVLTQFAVRYLASPQAAAELREMGAGASQDTPEAKESSDTAEEAPGN